MWYTVAMPTPKRNRSQGWKHAKVSGHKNEVLVAEYLNSQSGKGRLRSALPAAGSNPNVRVESGHVESVLPGKTTPGKPDLEVVWDADKSTPISTPISLKKQGGQVAFHNFDNFVRGFEKQFKQIPPTVNKALRLYFGQHPDSKTALASIEPLSDRIRELENRHNHRMVFRTLEVYDPALGKALIDWLKLNIADITRFCFARGLAKDSTDWAEYLLYMNLFDRDSGLEEMMFAIEDLADAAGERPDLITAGPKYGGSTIHLPFGFMQFHQGQIQFHQQPVKVRALAAPLPLG